MGNGPGVISGGAIWGEVLKIFSEDIVTGDNSWKCESGVGVGLGKSVDMMGAMGRTHFSTMGMGCVFWALSHRLRRVGNNNGPPSSSSKS